MFLIELFVPLAGPQGGPMDQAIFDRIKNELTKRYGGVTAFVQAPAEGVWKSPTEGTVEDRMAVLQVMVKEVEVNWWKDFRTSLEEELHQEEILVRALYMSKI